MGFDTACLAEQHFSPERAELVQTAANPEITERICRIAASYERVLEEQVLFGTLTEIVDTFRGYQEELGVAGVVIEGNYSGQIPADRLRNSLRLTSGRGDAALQVVPQIMATLMKALWFRKRLATLGLEKCKNNQLSNRSRRD